ncbi:HTTM domain-containing protein [Candidatus Peregrinibacteria bacterium]|nr:HTTM domain-containing protein [Candidatus Peregrinibacteria bacterium]
MIAKGPALGISIFRILWTPVQISFALYIIIWTWDEWSLPALPYHPLLTPFTFIPPSLIIVLSFLYLLFAILVGIGWHTRFSQNMLAILSIPLFFHSASTYHNHYAFALFITFFLTLSPTERFFSLDACNIRRALSPSAFRAWQNEEFLLTGQFLILLQTSFLYFFSALNKTNPDWFWRWSATPEFADLSHSAIFGPLISLLLQHHLLWIPMIGIIMTMFAFTIGLFLACRHPWIAFVGILFHLLLELSLPVILFTPMMMSIWILAMFPAEHSFTKSIEKSLMS